MRHPLLPSCPLLTLGDTAPQTALPRQFRLCVWNWHKCKHPGWQQDFLTLCAQSDLFLAQEARLALPTRQLLAQSGLQWNAAISFVSPRRKLPTGIAAGCRAAAQDLSFFAAAHEPLLRIPKMTMRLVYPLAHTRLLVVHLHAINFTGLSPFEQTLRQAENLLAEFDGPVIVAGDFNTWSQKRTRALQAAAQRLQLQEVVFRPDLRTRYLRRPVDYVFTRGLHTVRAEALPMTSSDHRPLTATLRLPEPRLQI